MNLDPFIGVLPKSLGGPGGTLLALVFEVTGGLEGFGAESDLPLSLKTPGTLITVKSRSQVVRGFRD